MANQSSPDQPLMVWYMEEGSSKHLELSNWAKRKLSRKLPLTEVARAKAVDKLRKLKEIGIAIALGFSYTRDNNK